MLLWVWWYSALVLAGAGVGELVDELVGAAVGELVGEGVGDLAGAGVQCVQCVTVS